MRRRPGERKRKCRGKPLTAVAQGSGFLCRCRKTTVSGVSRKSGGILPPPRPPVPAPRGRRYRRHTGGERKRRGAEKNYRGFLQLSGAAFTRSHLKACISFIQLASDIRHFYCNCRVMLIGPSCSGRGRVLTPLTPRSGLCQP